MQAPSCVQICNLCKWCHLVVKFATNASGAIWLTNASGILFSWRDNSSFRCYTLGPLCLWQCLKQKDACGLKSKKARKVARSIPNIFNCFLRNSPDANLMLLISPKVEINLWMHKLWKHTIDITYHLSMGNILLSSVLSSPLCVDQMPELVLQASWQNLQIKKRWAPSVELWINFVHIVADICTTHTWFETRRSNKHCQKAFALTQIYLYTTTFICPAIQQFTKEWRELSDSSHVALLGQ